MNTKGRIASLPLRVCNGFLGDYCGETRMLDRMRLCRTALHTLLRMASFPILTLFLGQQGTSKCLLQMYMLVMGMKFVKPGDPEDESWAQTSLPN